MSTEETGFAPDPEAELDLDLASVHSQTGIPPQQETQGETDPALLASLRCLGDQWGPLGVAIAALKLTDQVAFLRALEDGDNPVAPIPDADVEPSLPPGAFGRIDLPGYRNHTGWVTEETRFGVQAAVVRDWQGRVTAEVVMGPGCQFVHLPAPLKRLEVPEQVAIPAGPGEYWGESADEPGDWDERNPF